MSPGFTRNPVCQSSIISGKPDTRVARTGVPHAIASSATRGNASETLGSTSSVGFPVDVPELAPKHVPQQRHPVGDPQLLCSALELPTHRPIADEHARDPIRLGDRLQQQVRALPGDEASHEQGVVIESQFGR